MLLLGEWSPTPRLWALFARAAEAICRVLVTRSKSGIVNVYGPDASSWGNNDRPRPLKAIGNLTTAISAVRFNHDTQLLAIASKAQKDQLRLVWLVLRCWKRPCAKCNL